MSMQFLLVTFPEQRAVLADGAGIGFTNHTMLLPGDEYEITLEGTGYTPASQQIALGGTSIVKPMVIAFALASGAAGATRGMPWAAADAAAPQAATPRRPSPPPRKAAGAKTGRAAAKPAVAGRAEPVAAKRGEKAKKNA